jgi:acyl-CoA synthetase (NDP forming)
MRPLARLLRPRSVAVLGGGWAREVIRQLLRFGYEGALWPVHPKEREIEGLAAFASLAALPSPPDAVFLGVNRFETIRLVGELAASGAGGVVSFASGFAETGAEGEALQAALIAAAGEMPVLGPNCYGFINAFDRALLWPDLHGCEPQTRGVALIAQSSNIAINLTMARRSLPIGYVLCLGNQAVVGLPQAIEAIAEDARVSVIALHIEAIGDARAFAVAIAFARGKGKPVIALRAGRSERSREMVQSHTASLAGSAAVGAAFLKRLGVAEVETLPELLETAKLLHVLGPLDGKGLVSLSCSGGEASLVADAAARAGVSMPPFAAARLAAIRATVNPLVTVSNPFDYHTFDWGAGERLRETFAEVMASGQSATALVLDYPKAELGPVEGWDVALEAFSAAARQTGAKAMVVATLPECFPQDRASRLISEGVAPMQGLGEMLTAFRAAAEIGAAAALAPFAPLPRVERNGATLMLDEAEAKARLSAFGLLLPEGEVVTTREAALAAVARYAPAAMKICCAHIAHKTELGGVRLGLTTPEAASAAFADLSRISDRILVERMAAEPLAELIVGAARDPALGLHLVIGAGGVLAELIADTAILMLPVTEAEARAALASLKIDKLLGGWRGKRGANREAIVAAILSIADFACAHAAELEELDVNPLIVTERDAIAVDALIRMRKPQ